MRRCPHKCPAPRSPLLSGRRARELASRSVEDLPALPSAGACVRVAVPGAAVRGSAWGGRARSRSRGCQRTAVLASCVYRREGRRAPSTECCVDCGVRPNPETWLSLGRAVLVLQAGHPPPSPRRAGTGLPRPWSPAKPALCSRAAAARWRRRQPLRSWRVGWG